MNRLIFSIALFTLGFSSIAAEPAPATGTSTSTSGKMDSCRAAQDAARESIKAIEDAKTSGDPAKLKAALDQAQVALGKFSDGSNACMNQCMAMMAGGSSGATGATGMSCCPPGLIAQMAQGQTIGLAAGILGGLVLLSSIAVLLSLTVFLLRRSRVRSAVAT